MSTDMNLAVETVRFAMSLEQLRAKVAAHNIAMANVPGGQGDAPQRLRADGCLARLAQRP